MSTNAENSYTQCQGKRLYPFTNFEYGNGFSGFPRKVKARAGRPDTQWQASITAIRPVAPAIISWNPY